MSPEVSDLEVFQDLYLRGPNAKRPALRKALLDSIVAPWRHAEEREKQLRRDVGGGSDVLAFQRDVSKGFAAATLWLWSESDGYKVSNIVPLEIGKLAYSQYNALLQDFEKTIAAPAARKVGFRVETTPARQSIEDWVSLDAATALHRFSRAANKSTGSGHPLDRERWFQFLIQAHRDNSRLDTESLARWLIEIEGWDEDHAHELVIEYEFALALLDKYDRRLN